MPMEAGHLRNFRLSFDALVLIPFAGIYVSLYQRDPKGTIVAACLGAYLLIDLFWPWGSLPPGSSVRKRIFLIKLALMLLAIAMVTLLPTALWMALRRAGDPVTLIDDSMAQIEVGLDFIRQGTSPYGQDYTNTLMGRVPFYEYGLINPSLHHVAYFPFLFEFSYPFYAVALKLWGWWDQRLMYVAMLMACLGLLPQLTHDLEKKLALLPMLGLNPMLMLGFLKGNNEVFPLMWITLSAISLYRGRIALSAILLALAGASKLTTWFLAPFFLLHLLEPWHRKSFGQLGRQLGPGIAAFVVSFVPFLFSNPRSLLMDTFGFLTGVGPDRVFVGGVGLGEFLVGAGIIRDRLGEYPFWLWQVGLGLPLMIAMFMTQLRDRDPRLVWIHGGMLGLVVTFLGRYFLDSYLAFFLLVAALGAMADPLDKPIAASDMAGHKNGSEA